MKIRKTMLVVVVMVTFGASAGYLFGSFMDNAFGDKTETVTSPPPPPFFMKMGLSGICGNDDQLFVMAGGKILMYSLDDMSLTKSVDLPDPVPPADAPQPPEPPPAAMEDMPFHGPPMQGPHGLWINDKFLYVLAGPKIYEYSIPDLTVLSTVELPRPEPPESVAK